MGGLFSSGIRCPDGIWTKPHPNLNWSVEFAADLVREIKQISTQRSLKPCILFVGPISNGKSSLVNTLLSAGASDLVHKADTGTDEKSLTARFARYDGVEDLKNAFRVCDTSGILSDVNRGIRCNDFLHVMNGHVASGYKFQENADISEDDPYYVKVPKDQDKSHCLAIILSSTQVNDGLSTNYTDKVRETIRAARETGIRSMIILTKLDLICNTLRRDKTQVFACPHVEKVVKDTSELFGVPKGLIFPLINYSSERSKYESVAVDVLALLALRRMTKLSFDYLEGNELE